MSNLRVVLTTSELKNRIKIDKHSAIDKRTNKVYFCPRDLGFDYTLEDCKTACCSECWQDIKNYLENSSKSEEES